jgi:hypothetical protein
VLDCIAGYLRIPELGPKSFADGNLLCFQDGPFNVKLYIKRVMKSV